MANTTIKGIILHNGSNIIINDNSAKKVATLVIMPLYLNDADLTDVLDFGGVVKTITLTGVYQGANTAAIKTWIASIEALIQGHQDIQAGAPYTFIDDLRGTIKVKIIDFDTTWLEGDPTKVTWILKIVQSSTNA